MYVYIRKLRILTEAEAGLLNVDYDHRHEDHDYEVDYVKHHARSVRHYFLEAQDEGWNELNSWHEETISC